MARTSSGGQADAYEAFLERTGLADITATPGNRGLMLLRRTEGGVTHFLLTSLWESEAAIKRFAGDHTRGPLLRRG